MRVFIKLIGLVLVLLGVYFVGQNIIFTTYYAPSYYAPYWWQDVSALVSIIALTLGIIGLIFFANEIGQLGWILIIAGILFVFVSGRVMLRPTSLWYFFISCTAMIAGFKLIRTGSINF
jgi:hypothetical protein